MRIKTIKKNKGQMKIQEMAFVLVAFIFLLGMLLLFFGRFQIGQIQDVSDQIRILRNQNMLQYVSNLPELGCSDVFSTTPCIDYDKLKIFATNTDINRKYEDLFVSSKISKIEINRVYPEKESFVIYTSSSNSTITFKTYVPICEERFLDNQCSIGIVKISTKTN